MPDMQDSGSYPGIVHADECPLVINVGSVSCPCCAGPLIHPAPQELPPATVIKQTHANGMGGERYATRTKNSKRARVHVCVCVCGVAAGGTAQQGEFWGPGGGGGGGQPPQGGQVTTAAYLSEFRRRNTPVLMLSESVAMASRVMLSLAGSPLKRSARRTSCCSHHAVSTMAHCHANDDPHWVFGHGIVASSICHPCPCTHQFLRPIPWPFHAFSPRSFASGGARQRTMLAMTASPSIQNSHSKCCALPDSKTSLMKCSLVNVLPFFGALCTTPMAA